MTEAQAQIRDWRTNVAKFAWDNFKFEPDIWQKEFFDVFPSQDEDKKRISLQACTGPGKTAAEAVAALNFMTCYSRGFDHPQGLCISITGDNLDANLWPALSRLQQRSEFIRTAFRWTATRFSAVDHPETWFLEARTFPKKADAETQGRTLSGLHAPYVLVILDESGDIPVPVLRSGEQIFSSSYKWAKLIQGGNPTSRSGALYHAASVARHLWRIIRITGDPDDPKRSPRVDIENAREQIRMYGRENPWVKATILGEFPDADINALVSVEEVEAAMGKHLREDEYSWAQKRLGIDAAWRGDDQWVIWPRQGLASFRPVAMRNPKTQEVGSRIISAKIKFGSEREYFDNTGGFAQGAYDFVEAAGYDPVPVDFSGKANDPRFYNTRSEIWWRGTQMIKNGGALPNVPALVPELTTMTFTYKNGKMLMMPKDMQKAIIGRSPDHADAYMLTFTDEEMPRELVSALSNSRQARTNEDPFADEQRKARIDFDPYRDHI